MRPKFIKYNKKLLYYSFSYIQSLNFNVKSLIINYFIYFIKNRTFFYYIFFYLLHFILIIIYVT